MKIANILVILSVFALWSEASFALNQLKYFKPGLWTLTADSSYLYSDSNFTNSGTNSSLVSGNNYQLLLATGTARYVLNQDWALFSGFNFSYAQSKGFDATRSNSTINGLIFGAQYLLSSGNYDWIPEISYLYPLEKNSNTSDTVMTSEGVSEFSAKMHLQVPTNDYSIFGYLGYTYRSNGRSTLLPWSAGLEIPVGNTKWGAELYGFQTISDDSDKGNTVAESARNAEIFKANAGSSRFYSLNPSLIDSNLYARFNLNRKTAMSVGAGYAFAGNNYAAGLHVLLNLQYNFGLAPVRKKSISVPVNHDYRPRIDNAPQKKFDEDTDDGVDQSLFEPPPLPADEEIKPKRVEPPPAPTEEQVQQKLDDVEMSIELKRKKKK